MMNKEIKALYIHIPFCEAICDYCDFPKLQYFRIFAEQYITELSKELDSYHINHQLDTIYVGGGTPTCLEDGLFEQLLILIKPYTKGVKEYTVEANPESLSEHKLTLMKQYGVNRLSIGVESTNDKILKAINRHHTFQDVKIAIKRAKSIGFDNLSVDLIIGLPHVLKGQLNEDITKILSLGVSHISCYSLSVHPNTVFGIKGIKERTSDTERELYDLVNQKLSDSGYEHYEISNWCLPGYESKHNLTYWKDEQYYGIGLGASGYINDVRYTNTRSITEYLKGKRVIEKEVVTLKDDREYFILLNLRTNRGIPLDLYQAKFHENLLETKKEEIQNLIKQKLLYIEGQNLIATYDGMMVLDQVILQLF